MQIMIYYIYHVFIGTARITISKNGKIMDELNGKELSEKLQNLYSIARMQLGSKVDTPYMDLSFLSLSIIPSWKIIDKGLVEKNNYRILEPIIESYFQWLSILEF